MHLWYGKGNLSKNAKENKFELLKFEQNVYVENAVFCE